MTDNLAIYVDGASSGNPGDAGIGFVIKSKSKEERFSSYIGVTTNNFAEYQALVAALKRARQLGARAVEIKSDSELMVKQLKGEYKVKSANLKELHELSVKLAKEFCSFAIEHVGRDFNKEADKLAKGAIIEYKRANRMVASHGFKCEEESPSSSGQRSG